MYAPPEDRSSLLLAQLARLQGLAAERPVGAFDARLASARNEVAHLTQRAGRPTAAAGLALKRSLRAGAF